MRHSKFLYTIFTFFFLFQYFATSAQNMHGYVTEYQTKKDSLIKEINKLTKADTNRVNALLELGKIAMFKKETEEALPYTNEAMELGKKLKYNAGVGIAYLCLGNYYKSIQNYNLAITNFDTGINTIGPTTNLLLQDKKAFAYRTIGLINIRQENYPAALTNMFEALKYFEANKDLNSYNLVNAIHIHTSIIDIYLEMNNIEAAKIYATKNLQLIEKDTTKANKAQALFHFINIGELTNDIALEETYLNKLNNLMPTINEVSVKFWYYIKLGKFQLKKNQSLAALSSFEKALAQAELMGYYIFLNPALTNLSRVSLQLSKLSDAKKYAERNLSVAQGAKNKENTMEALKNLAEYYNKTGNNTEAYNYLYQSIALKDSIILEKNLKQMNTLGVIYESEKKENEILQLNTDKQVQKVTLTQKTRTNIFLSVLAIGLTLIGFLGYRNFRAKQNLQKQTITQLEKDKQLLAINAMLKGQEEERSRLAKDLHDGLGGMLSGVKLSFTNMKENLIMDAENVQTFEASIKQLDGTIAELRKVAHNLMPEALVRFGLKNAVLDFCNAMQLNSKTKIIFEQMGVERQLSNNADLYIYRMIQELINNAIKHANPKEILVQITKTENKVLLTVEDDGKGFKKEDLHLASGIGMKNIQQRVDYFKGNLDISTKEGEGTSINIELYA